jgi:hypothetical protein
VGGLERAAGKHPVNLALYVRTGRRHNYIDFRNESYKRRPHHYQRARGHYRFDLGKSPVYARDPGAGVRLEIKFSSFVKFDQPSAGGKKVKSFVAR